MTRVRLTGEWKGVPEGTVVEVTPGRASALQRLGIAKPVVTRKKKPAAKKPAAKKTPVKKGTTDSGNDEPGPDADD
jgi:hypothetical protein